MLLAVAVAMVVAHEAGHVLLTLRFGGHWRSIEFRGYAVGVRLFIDGLSPAQLAWTLAAGPLAEGIVIAIAVALWPGKYPWWLLLLGLQWVMNIIPWGRFPNDGTRLWQLWWGQDLL